MNWKIARFLYDPDDAGGATGEGDGATPPDLKAVADSIRTAILEARATPPPAPPPPAADTRESTRQALLTEANSVNAKVDELVNAGRASEAFALRDDFQRRASAALAPATDDNVMVKTAVALGERLAKSTHGDVMKRWPDEVKRAVDALPIEERVRPDAWDTAVAKVRSNHFDEILNETVTARVEEARKSFVPPPTAPGSRGTRPATGAASKLSEEQLWGADLCNVTPEEYAAQVTREEAFDNLPFRERAKFTGYPVLNDPRGNSIVEKGKF